LRIKFSGVEEGGSFGWRLGQGHGGSTRLRRLKKTKAAQ
jgi:hypothetical protein